MTTEGLAELTEQYLTILASALLMLCVIAIFIQSIPYGSDVKEMEMSTRSSSFTDHVNDMMKIIDRDRQNEMMMLRDRAQHQEMQQRSMQQQGEGFGIAAADRARAMMGAPPYLLTRDNEYERSRAAVQQQRQMSMSAGLMGRQIERLSDNGPAKKEEKVSNNIFDYIQ